MRAATRTATRLSDGRAIVWYDEQPSVLDRTDRRGLQPTQVRSEARFDPLLGEWVVIASHRQDRTHLPPDDECPLCPTSADRETEVPAADYDVVVFENLFPSLAADVPTLGGPPLFGRMPGRGRCEVVCFSSDHADSFGRLPTARVRTVVDVWADRTDALGQVPGVEHVFPFENRGADIGVTLSHPHGQVYGYPFVPPRIERQLASAEAHDRATGRNLFDDVLAAERTAGVRVVAEGEHWTAFVPSAARWPVEVHLYPHRRVPDLTATTDVERDELAVLLPDVLRRIDGLHGVDMPYVAAWHQAPVHRGRDVFALHLEVFSTRRAPGKLKHLAGSESGMGVWINDVTPEAVAEQLRAFRP